ncbi:helix-turn-helix domain-containing protein [Streptomyces violaceus]|uniref:Helix-turn-helix transcriptional regulator n=1 Tax=Streptomyces violaceus TaxID=1936 RepID=A0ABY9U5G5_STRVL|nr:helix-turn-helix transcriptional regulator [Streptomyces janthinus]WND17546.1 helix-turn-helix transcriptional regulator [Streptomyces janthinus]GGS37152.1 transcriptional regulator [Streptomyces janthinus]
MSADFQRARAALGDRLRELRRSCPDGRLTGTQLAERLGWPQSKISKLENGRQTATAEDLAAWAEATGQPSAIGELTARLKGLEPDYRSWRRQLAAGHRPVQDALNAEHDQAKVFHAWQGTMVPGVLQTADCARHVFIRYAELHRSKRDTEEAVRARMKRQEGLYNPEKRFNLLVGETALRSLICPPSVLVAQLDRLMGVVGMNTVNLGVVPFSAPLKIPPANGFLLYDERLVIVEDWHAELWINDQDSVRTYMHVWATLHESAVYGAEAQRVISAARQAL